MDRARALSLEAAGPLGRRHPLLLVLGAAVLVFLALPLLVVVPISFSAAKYLTFPLAAVAVPKNLFARILERIARLRPACASG